MKFKVTKLSAILTNLLAKVPNGLLSPKYVHFTFEFFFQMIGLRRKQSIFIKENICEIVVIKLDAIGDVVLASPFLRELRFLYPTAKITLVVNPLTFNIVEHCPYIDTIYIFNTKATGRLIKKILFYRCLKLAMNKFWGKKIDLAIIPRWDIDYYFATYLAYLSGARKIVGYSTSVSKQKAVANRDYDFFLTNPIKQINVKHEVEQNLKMLSELGHTPKNKKLEVWFSDVDIQSANTFLLQHNITPLTLFVCMAPGANEPKRMWPIERFVSIASWLYETHKIKVIVVGGEEEKSLLQPFGDQASHFLINAAGCFTLRQTAAIIKQSCLMVSNDSGPMHIAAALNVPIVELSPHPANGPIFSPNSPMRFGPWETKSKILQPLSATPPCQNKCDSQKAHCILSIEIGQVKKAINQLLK